MMLDGKILRDLFEHERLKPAIIRTSHSNVNSLVQLKQTLTLGMIISGMEMIPLVQPLKFEIIKELSLKVHSLGTLHQGDDLMKSPCKHLFVGKESPKYPENPFRITFVCMHILGLQLIYNFIEF